MAELDDLIAQALAEIESTVKVDDSDEDIETAIDSSEEQSLDETELDDELDDDDDDTDGSAIEVDPETLIKLPDGRTVSVKDGLELKADYTRKTQELAEQRKEVEGVYSTLMEWRDSVVKNPTDFVVELVQAKVADPAELANSVVSNTADPTATLAQLIQHMLEGGNLSKEFIEFLGLDDTSSTIKQTAKDARDSERLERLERELEARKAADEARDVQAKLMNDYEYQIDSIIREEGLDPAKRDEFVVELVTFAKEAGLVDNLAHAYAVYARTQERTQKVQAASAAKTAERKRATRAMASQSAGPSSVQQAPERYDSYESAAAAALAELTKRWK